VVPVLALPLVDALATVAIGVVLGRTSGDLLRDVFPMALIVPLVVLIPAFTEELAWRGFAVPRLMTAVSPLAAGLLLASPWVIIHVPLLLPGAMNEGAELWPMIVSITGYAVILTWVFVGSGGSVLLAGPLHAGLNGTVPLMRAVDADTAWVIRALTTAAVAIAIIAFGGFRVLQTRGRDR
jgi:membrane protease YdiL (CAAX protease family)